MRTVLERCALAVLYFSMSGPDWTFPFLSSTDVCTWNDVSDTNSTIGITCDDDDDTDTVTGLALSNSIPYGTIPWEIVLLSDLRSINFNEGGLAGSIPSQMMANLTKLEVFIATNSSLSGYLPPNIPPSLRHVDLGYNFIKGTIPSNWGEATVSFEEIHLGTNFLTGTIPTSFGQLANLTILDVSDNELNGGIPPSLGKLPNLIRLDVGRNVLQGTIPSELSQINSLTEFMFDNNRLTGSVNETFCRRSLGDLDVLQADCDEVECPCCTSCCVKEIDYNGYCYAVPRQ